MKRLLWCCCLLAAACGSSPDPGGDGPSRWQLEADDLDAAILSIFAIDEEATDLLAVGGPLAGEGAPAILRREGSGTWVPQTPPPGASGALWWGFAARSDDLWLVGARGTVLNGRLDVLEQVPLPDVGTATRATFYGVWAASEDDVWIVGGSPGDPRGPGGLILRWNGRRLDRIPLTGTASSATGATFFKVWGRSADDVWIVGDRGVVLHFDGVLLERVDTGRNDRLLTVHGGAAGPVYAVGGVVQGTMLSIEDQSVRAVEVEGQPPLNGVFTGEDLVPWVVGSNGYLARWNGSVFSALETEVIDRDFHVVFVGADGVFAAGGSLAVLEGPRRGLIGRFGP